MVLEFLINKFLMKKLHEYGCSIEHFSVTLSTMCKITMQLSQFAFSRRIIHWFDDTAAL